MPLWKELNQFTCSKALFFFKKENDRISYCCNYCFDGKDETSVWTLGRAHHLSLKKKRPVHRCPCGNDFLIYKDVEDCVDCKRTLVIHLREVLEGFTVNVTEVDSCAVGTSA